MREAKWLCKQNQALFMDAKQFFEQSSGKWFSQRTHHDLSGNQCQSGKSDIWIDVLPADAPKVAELCQQHQVDPSQALLGLQIRWEGGMASDTSKRQGSSLLVPLSHPEQPNCGPLLQSNGVESTSPATSRYSLGSDEAMTLITETDQLYIEERLWYASPALRFRTSTLKRTDGFSLASFWSEIRMGTSQPAS